MHLLYCDESNLPQKAGDFLLYGGLIIDGAKAGAFSKSIDKIRADAKVERAYRLKFNPGPKDFTNDQFIQLKKDIVSAAIEHGAQIVVYAVLHDIAKDADLARRNGINQVCYSFDCILNRMTDSGIVLIDRFNDTGSKIDGHLVQKFTVGLTDMPYSKEIRLSNIVGFHYSAIGQSHFPSVNDVILGSLRFAINAHTRNTENHLDTARAMLGILSPLFFREKAGEAIPELGFTLSPKVIKLDAYRQKYQSVKDFLQASGVKLSQSITAERQY